MPFVKSLVSRRRTYIVTVILSLSEIMPTYSCCVLKGLVYIIIIAPLGRQPSSYIKYTKSNIRSSYNVRLVFNAKYAFLIRSYILQSLQLPYLICLRVLYNSYCKKTQL